MPKAQFVIFDEIPGVSSWLLGKNRPRRLCEYVGYSYEDCEKGTEQLMHLKQVIANAREQLGELAEKCNSLGDKNSRLSKENDKLAEQVQNSSVDAKQRKDAEVEIIRATAAKHLGEMNAKAKVYRDAGRALGEVALTFGDHLTDCNIWEFRRSGRLEEVPEEELCSCGWTKDKQCILLSKKNAKENPMTDEQAKALLDKYNEKEDNS